MVDQDPEWTLLVLTGGRSRRLGRDKATTTVAGVSMLDRLVAGVPSTVPVVVAGPEPRDPPRPVEVRREDPPGGGPVAGIAAALPAVGTPLVVVAAVDLPHAAPVLTRLADALRDAATPAEVDAVLAVDTEDVAQPLLAAYRTAALRRAVAALPTPAGAAARALLEPLRTGRLAVGERATDVDTPAELAASRRRAGWGEILGTNLGGAVMQDWVDAVRAELAIADDVNVDLILDVAKDAAHGVARPAAPVTTFLLGVAVGRGADPAAAAAVITHLAQRWTADA